MRIGQINSHNYQAFLQMLGIKNSKTLDAIMRKDEDEDPYRPLNTEDDWIRLGYMSEDQRGMLVTNGDNSWQKIVPVPDEVSDKIIQAVRKQFLENKGNLVHPDKPEWWVITNIMKDYRASIAPKERLSAMWTLSQVQLNEVRRLENLVKQSNPGWTPGNSFDKNILLKSNFGENSIDVKV